MIVIKGISKLADVQVIGHVYAICISLGEAAILFSTCNI